MTQQDAAAAIAVSRREVYRYMGIRGEPDPQTAALAESVIAELSEKVTPRVVSRVFPLHFTGSGEMDMTAFSVRSDHLAVNLAGCTKVRLFAATLGEGADFVVRRYSRIRISRAAAAQAAAAAMIEDYCRQLCEAWKEEARQEGLFLRPRFSPGYGDFSLSYQSMFCDVLKTGKTIGVTLTDSFLMVPSKSVTAVIGMSPVRTDCVPSGCEACGNTACSYRRHTAEPEEAEISHQNNIHTGRQ